MGRAVPPLRLAAEGLADGSLREVETLGFAFSRTYGLVRLAAGRFTRAQEAAYTLCAGLVGSDG